MEVYSFTGAQLAQQVEEKFGDAGNVQITRSMQLGWINNGIRAITEQIEMLEKVVSTPLIAGQSVYDLAALFGTQRIITVSLVTVAGTSIELIGFAEFQKLITDGGNLTGVPQTNTAVGTMFADKLTLWPTPNKTVANGLTIYCEVSPAPLATINDALTIPDRLYNSLFDYVMAQALELDENFEASQVKLAHHQQSLQRNFEKETRSPNAFYPSITPDPDDFSYGNY